MRTTITLDADVVALVRKRMRERDVTFKDAVNDALREGLLAKGANEAPRAYRTPSFDLGGARVDVTHALRLAASLDDALHASAATE